MLDFRTARFVASYPDLRSMGRDEGIEVAFAGRSNSGKSSALNAICDHRNLARISRTPGRTQLINAFVIAPGKTLIDLPGYGYAKVPGAMKRNWQRSMTTYLQSRRALRGLVVTMDIRNPLMDHDRLIVSWAAAAGLETAILLTKADKLGVQGQREVAREVMTALGEYEGTFRVIPFSAVKRIGIADIRTLLETWFSPAPAADDAPGSTPDPAEDS